MSFSSETAEAVPLPDVALLKALLLAERATAYQCGVGRGRLAA